MIINEKKTYLSIKQVGSVSVYVSLCVTGISR